MLRLVLALTVVAAAYAATTVSPAQILYDVKHHKAMIVMSDGCYEYHLNHQDMEDQKNDATKAILEARMLAELAMAINKQEMGHHHIDHMSNEIQTACASVPVYSWELPPADTTTLIMTATTV
ncbi:uncharacterized protein LOC128204678 [Mya arenaria]|uniref:uncharacterized protein LOC128204678 n=1 Tax=Mya arenaria TaxID=6604 RepID=UPI0022E8CAB9|nr:uncharacterized protein LOC128204678 [Mya arenaria]